MEPWREAMGLNRPRWLGIAEQLAKITNLALDRNGKNFCDLTNHLRQAGNQDILPEFIDEYLTGKASFGCFFQQYQEFLRIDPLEVFPKSTPEEAQAHLGKLIKYLGSTHNVEFLVSYMIPKPGAELRAYIKKLVHSPLENFK
jgi:hypothetical protein